MAGIYIGAKNKNDFAFRIKFLIFLVFLLFGIIFIRLFYLQFLRHDLYKVLAQDQHEFFEKTLPKRGNIYIKDLFSKELYPLAVNKEYGLVYAVPNNIKDKKETSEKIAEILGLKKEDVFNIINKDNDPYEVIKHRVEDDAANKIEESKLEGVAVAAEVFRYYPGQSLAANIAGFVGFSGDKKIGQYGIEGYYNDLLEGSFGFLEFERDVSGNWISIGAKNSALPKNGDDIVLTIDKTIQYISEKKLKEAVEKYGAEKGNLIVLDPRTGEIIAMAQYPSFNPNEYNNEKDLSVFLNSSVHDVYEPGSIQKTITMAIGLDLNKVSPSDTYVDKGKLVIDGWSIENSDDKANGEQTMTQVLEKSLNTGAVYVQQKIGRENFYKYLKNFELDQPTGIEISGEANGNLSNLLVKNDINYATVSFGQGISVTPLSILMAISSFANDGKLVRPRIVNEIIHSDGTVEKTETKFVRRVVSARAANLVASMMVSVFENGHLKNLKIKGYKFAGKTGTAQIPKKNGKGYETGQTIHTLVGFGPIPNPKFSILVKLDKPKALFAESTAAIVFRDMAKELVNYYNIPPTESLE